MKKLLIIIAILLLAVPVSAGTTLTKTIKPTTKTITVRKGQQIRIRVKGKKARFVAKKNKTFAITKKGVLTAKKVGSAKFKYKIGKKTKTVKVVVKAASTPKPTGTDTKIIVVAPTTTPTPSPTQTKDDPLVWKSATGKKYHSIDHCGTMNPAKAEQITLSEALKLGLTKCSNCWSKAA